MFVSTPVLSALQLEKHVSEWKRMVSSSPDGGSPVASSALVAALEKVTTIENNILQANSDSLLIIDNISGVLNHMKR